MKYPQAPRAALGLMLTLLALLVPLSTSAAPNAKAQANPAIASTEQAGTRTVTTPVKTLLAWHRVGSPGTSRDIAIG